MSKTKDDSNEGGAGERGGLNRRALLKGALATVGAGVAAAVGVKGQVTGLMPGGGKVPFRLPLGALDYLDRKQYISNMEIVSHLPGVTISSGEPLMAMWARGRQRMLPGGGGWVDISDPRKPVAVKTPSRIQGAVVYNTSLKKWIMMSSAGQPLTAAVPGHPYGQYDKEVLDRARGYAGLRGIRTYDITDPTTPKLLQEFSTGKTGTGTHHNFYDGGKYAYLECGWDETLRMENAQRANSNGLMIVDLSDPADVKEVARWWVPGQRLGEEAEYKKYIFAGDQSSWSGNHGSMAVPTRPEDGGTIGYAQFGAFGMFVMDLTDITRPRPIGHLRYEFETIGGIPYHTVYPVITDAAHPKLRNILIGVHETIEPDCREPYRSPYVIDVNDPRNPRIIALFPRPKAPQDAPYSDFCFARGRFSAHNCQCWIAPGASHPEIFAAGWFNAGLRVFDLSEPTQPREIAWFVPPRDGQIEDYGTWFRGTSESAFIEWDRNLIWLGTHEGTYCLSTPRLGTPVLEPRKIERWSVPHCNIGWDDQTAASVYFGRALSRMGRR